MAGILLACNTQWFGRYFSIPDIEGGYFPHSTHITKRQPEQEIAFGLLCVEFRPVYATLNLDKPSITVSWQPVLNLP